jgi:hypothetical protein
VILKNKDTGLSVFFVPTHLLAGGLSSRQGAKVEEIQQA